MRWIFLTRQKKGVAAEKLAEHLEFKTFFGDPSVLDTSRVIWWRETDVSIFFQVLS